jgi:Cu-processing system ATP-binding protein
VIVARGLSKRFGSVEVLRSLDIAVARGRVTALVGPNGAGKTTFIKCLLGLTRPDAGVLEIDGVSVRHDERYREHVGYMPQIANFPDNLTGAEFLTLLRTLREVDIADERLIDDFGLRPFLNRQLRVLSGGTRQKVNAVAAFLFAPDLLVLDEPTSGLDPVAAGVMKARIRSERAAGRTIVITSHVLSDIDELADDIIYLSEGQVQFSGRSAELRVNTGQPTIERAIATLMTRETA